MEYAGGGAQTDLSRRLGLGGGAEHRREEELCAVVTDCWEKGLFGRARPQNCKRTGPSRRKWVEGCDETGGGGGGEELRAGWDGLKQGKEGIKASAKGGIVGGSPITSFV